MRSLISLISSLTVKVVMGQFSTNSYVNERKQPKNGLNNCPTNNGTNDTENNEKTSTRQIIEHPHSPLMPMFTAWQASLSTQSTASFHAPVSTGGFSRLTCS